MIVWGRADDIQREVAHVPEHWLSAFMVRHPGDVRKFGTSRNSTLLFRSDAVLAAVEAGETSEPLTPPVPPLKQAPGCGPNVVLVNREGLDE